MEKMQENNQVRIEGKFVSPFVFSHEREGEKFYTAYVETLRLSGNKDTIPIMVSEKIIGASADYTGRPAQIEGQFRSYNAHVGSRSKLILSVHIRDLQMLDRPAGSEKGNNIFIAGYICKAPIYRTTPLGREITDIILAVNGPNGHSDYIPCIAWGRNAKYAESFLVGDEVHIWGRIQSREYVKKIDDSKSETRTAYEVSASSVIKISGKDGKA